MEGIIIKTEERKATVCQVSGKAKGFPNSIFATLFATSFPLIDFE